MLHPYPNDFPSEGIQMLIDVLQGNKVDVKEAAHAGWHLVGFGMSKWDVHTVTMAGDCDDGKCKADTIKYLEGLQAKIKSGVAFEGEDCSKGLTLPIIMFIVALIRKLLAGEAI